MYTSRLVAKHCIVNNCGATSIIVKILGKYSVQLDELAGVFQQMNT